MNTKVKIFELQAGGLPLAITYNFTYLLAINVK